MLAPKPHRAAPTCHDCGQPVIWAITVAGNRQALNPAPDPAGNTLAYKDALGAWRARSLASITADSPKHPLEKPYMPHAATCEKSRAGTPEGVASLAEHRRKSRR